MMDEGFIGWGSRRVKIPDLSEFLKESLRKIRFSAKLATFWRKIEGACLGDGVWRRWQTKGFGWVFELSKRLRQSLSDLASRGWWNQAKSDFGHSAMDFSKIQILIFFAKMKSILGNVFLWKVDFFQVKKI